MAGELVRRAVNACTVVKSQRITDMQKDGAVPSNFETVPTTQLPLIRCYVNCCFLYGSEHAPTDPALPLGPYFSDRGLVVLSLVLLEFVQYPCSSGRPISTVVAHNDFSNNIEVRDA